MCVCVRLRACVRIFVYMQQFVCACVRARAFRVLGCIENLLTSLEDIFGKKVGMSRSKQHLANQDITVLRFSFSKESGIPFTALFSSRQHLLRARCHVLFFIFFLEFFGCYSNLVISSPKYHS